MSPKTRKWVVAAAVSSALTLAAATPGLAQDDAAPDETAPPAEETLTVQGWLGDGVECPVIDADDGTRYGLSGEFDIPPGTYVEVTGELFEVSTCMEGEGTIAVEQIVEVDAAEPGVEIDGETDLDLEPGLDVETDLEPEAEPAG